MDPGNAAEWANVAVTGLALAAAGWAAWSTHRALGIERRRDEKRDMAEVASQAALVAAWPKRPSKVGDRPHGWKALVVNNSQVPVYDVGLTFESPDRPNDTPSHELGILPPGQAEVGYPRTWWEGTPDEIYGDDPLTMAAGDVSVSVMFTDATGMVWQRNGRGELAQVRGHDSMRFLQQTVWPSSAAGL